MSISVHRERAHRFGAGFRGFDPGPDPAEAPQRFLICGTLLSFLAATILMLFLIATISDARAQDQANILNRGDAVVTGFSGIKPADAPLPPGANPLDEFFIDLDGASAQILSFAAAGGAPNGQLMSAPALMQIKAREVGQVFATALDDGLGADVPNIYLGQTAAYGLHIVLPDADGDGWAERTKKGAPGAEWMGGQFSMAAGGGPGAIYKLNGKTGVVSLFASLPENSGAGVGDIVFDTATRQFFVSDLDNGLIYRLNETGAVIDSFDHGVTGRPEDELAELADDGSTVDIEDPAFDSEDPQTWGFTQVERRVHGLAIHDDRLFYAVDGQVWSVGISEEGFADASWELDAEALESDGPVTDMLFDAEGRLYLAQRGSQRASYDYSVFAEPEKSSVVRYRLEDPDDPATESAWVADPEEYAIGLPEEHRHAEGGIALGYSHDETGLLRYGSCGEMLWSTGHRLRPSAFAGEAAGETDPEADVHGLQGNAVSLVRPENAPPQQSYFADYDGFFGDAAKSGHMGDVEIWQPCEGSAPSYGQLPPGIFTPDDTPPDDLPPEFLPEHEDETNLELTKWASPKECSAWFGGWLCRYRIRVRNAGPDDYFGPVLIEDFLPANPAGAAMGFEPTPPWHCWNTGASAHKCFRPGVFLAPGASIGLKAYAWVPKDYGKCNLRNVAAIEWAPGGTQWNTDPFDDADSGNALIPSQECENPEEETDLKIDKRALLDCFQHDGGLRCGYRVTVENQGPGAYNGDIVVEDVIPAGTTAIFSGPAGTWDNCPKVAGVHTCTHANASLPNPGDSTSFTVRVDLSYARAKQLNCEVGNRVKITQAPGGSPQNTDLTNDEASAVADVPDGLCTGEPVPNLKIEKRPLNDLCFALAGHWCNYWEIKLTNTGPVDLNFAGETRIGENLPAGVSVSTSTPGWSCFGDVCKHAAPLNLVKNGGSTSFKVQVKGSGNVAEFLGCKLTNQVKILAPKVGGEADDQAQATRALPGIFCQKPNLKIEKRPLNDLCIALAGHWCNYWEIKLTNTGAPLSFGGITRIRENLPDGTSFSTSTPGWVCSGVSCTHAAPLDLATGATEIFKVQVSGSGELAKSLNCKLTNKVAILSPIVGGTSDDKAEATRDLPGQFCEQTILDGPGDLVLPPKPFPSCPPGYDWNGESCERIGISTPPPPPSRDCPAGFTGNYPDCDRIVTPQPDPECPRGYVGKPPNCRQIVRPDPTPQCTGGRVLRGGECVCRRGRVWNGERCVRRQCPDGTRGVYPDCRKVVIDPPRCTGGRVLLQGKCVCRGARVWNGERCVLRRCPRGYEGQPPNCKKIVRTCPRGFVGKPPNCRKVVVDPPRRCPEGFVGRPPNCRKIERCPPGYRGKPPRCRKIEPQRQNLQLKQLNGGSDRRIPR
ncbi:MAG: hypothetical protein ACFCUR_13430 [Rhodomicrobiaceae bacterium]